MMTTNLRRELSLMAEMKIGALREKYFEVFGEENRSRNRVFLIKRIAWRLQANAEGGLSERAMKRAAELALDSEVRVTPPKQSKNQLVVVTDVRPTPVRDDRLPPAGSMLHREYKGEPIRVLVLEDAFEYEGQRFKSLTAVANAITGSHINGFQFFKLRSSK